MQELHIDAEFKSLIPPLSDEECSALEQSILSEGCRDAIVTWNDIIVDGHNRYEICTRNNVPFKTVGYDFNNRDEAKAWMIQNQLARRNLHPFQRFELAHQYEAITKAEAKANSINNLAQNTDVEKMPARGRSRDILGSMAGMSGKTYEKAVKVMELADEETKDKLRRGETTISSAYKELQKPHVSYNSGNNEWYTPKEYIDAARRVMGSIDLDPASSEIANKVVQASEIYTIETDGLSHKWHGNLWLNPPYASDLIKLFVDKVSAEAENISQAIILVNNATETRWFSELVKVSSAVVFPTGRVNFYKPDGSVGAPLQGQAVFYIGNNSAKFLAEFVPFGWGVKLHELPKQ